MLDFSIIFQLKGLKPKNKGHVNFYECCDLTKNVYLVDNVLAFHWKISSITHSEIWEECRCRESANVAKVWSTMYYYYYILCVQHSKFFFLSCCRIQIRRGKRYFVKSPILLVFLGRTKKKSLI